MEDLTKSIKNSKIIFFIQTFVSNTFTRLLVYNYGICTSNKMIIKLGRCQKCLVWGKRHAQNYVKCGEKKICPNIQTPCHAIKQNKNWLKGTESSTELHLYKYTAAAKISFALTSEWISEEG